MVNDNRNIVDKQKETYYKNRLMMQAFGENASDKHDLDEINNAISNRYNAIKSQLHKLESELQRKTKIISGARDIVIIVVFAICLIIGLRIGWEHGSQNFYLSQGHNCVEQPGHNFPILPSIICLPMELVYCIIPCVLYAALYTAIAFVLFLFEIHILKIESKSMKSLLIIQDKIKKEKARIELEHGEELYYLSRYEIQILEALMKQKDLMKQKEYEKCNYGTVTIQIIRNGQPVVGERVSLYPEVTGAPFSQITDSRGQIYIDVPENSWRGSITVRAREVYRGGISCYEPIEI